MRIFRFSGVPARWNTVVAAGAVSLAGLGVSPAWAATDIQVWYSLPSHNEAVFEKLVKQFNREQDNVRVSLKSFDNTTVLETRLTAEAQAKSTKLPHLVQLEDNRSPEDIAARSYIQPLHTLLAKHPIKNADWFVSDGNGFMRDGKGRLLAFPYMVEVPVMFYNIDAYNKAGITPAMPQRSWAGLQDQLVNLANKATRYCPATTDEVVSINLENLAAVNNQFFTTQENGRKGGKAAPAFSFDTVFVRHLSLMISWVRTELMVKPELGTKARQRFADGECAVLLSDSSNIGRFLDKNTLKFGVSGLPYYPQVTKQPGNPFLDGWAIWATSGHAKDEDTATAQFLAWLAQPKNAAYWYQNTGYLPLTAQAFAATDSKYYKDLGEWQSLVAAYAKPPSSTTRSFRIKNYPKIRAMFDLTLERALSGEQPAVPALKSASAKASKLMAEK